MRGEYVSRQNIIQQRENLKVQYEALVQPSNAELIEFAKQIHPYYTERERLFQEWQELKTLIEYLQSL